MKSKIFLSGFLAFFVIGCGSVSTIDREWKEALVLISLPEDCGFKKTDLIRSGFHSERLSKLTFSVFQVRVAGQKEVYYLSILKSSIGPSPVVVFDTSDSYYKHSDKRDWVTVAKERAIRLNSELWK